MWRVWIPAVVALLAAFQYGIALTILNTMLESMSDDLNFDSDVGGGVATAALFLGACLSGLLAGPFERYSGKYSQPLIGMLYFVGNLLAALTTDNQLCWSGLIDGCVPTLLFVGRVLVGLASGLTLVVSPKFLAETTPPKIRGRTTAGTQLSIACGVFAGLFIGIPYDFKSFDPQYEWWRVMFWIACVPALTQVTLAFIILPSYSRPRANLLNSSKRDSPHEVIERVEIDMAVVSTDKSPQCHEIEDKENQICTVEKPIGSERPREHLSSLLERQYRRSVFLGIGVPIITQLSGVSVVGAYSTTIFEDAGFEHAVVASIILGVSEVIGSIVAIYTFDRLGRKTMAYLSFSGMALCLAAIAFADLGPNSVSGPISVVFLALYMVLFAVGCGPLMVAYAPEVVPSEISQFVLGAGQSLSLSTSLAFVLVFPSSFDALGVFSSFILLFCLSVVSLVYCGIFMIETKGRALEDIVAELKRL